LIKRNGHFYGVLVQEPLLKRQGIKTSKQLLGEAIKCLRDPSALDKTLHVKRKSGKGGTYGIHLASPIDRRRKGVYVAGIVGVEHRTWLFSGGGSGSGSNRVSPKGLR